MKTDITNRARRVVKGILLFYLFTFLPFSATAQKLVAENAVVNAGRTGYQMPITAVFNFRNKSSKKLRIEAVKPDCACTTIEYPQGDIGSNDKFQIRMTYDARQLGHFDKQAAIISNGSQKPLYIRMHGVVLEDYVDLAKHYPVEMGDLCLDKMELEYDDINRGDSQTQELRIYNNGTRPYQPNLMHLPPYLSAEVMPAVLQPHQAGRIVVVLNSLLLRDYGLTQTSVYLAGNPGDKVSPDHEIAVSAVMLPSFDQTATSSQAAPRLYISKEKVDVLFDKKKKKTEVIDIENRGQEELRITSLQMFTRGLKISLAKSVLKPGEKTKLKITMLRDELKTVRTRPRVLMICNDPQKPKVTITINAK